MQCPQCHNNQGYKSLSDYVNWFNCPVCGFICYMKHWKQMLFNSPKRMTTQVANQGGSYAQKAL